MPKAKAKAKPRLKWTSEANLFVLEWIDKHSGTEGGLCKDEDATIDSLIADDAFADQHKGMERFSGSSADEDKRDHIRAKFQEFWNDYKQLPKYEQAPYTKTTLYRKGTTMFDWFKIEAVYPGALSDEEFKNRKERAGFSPSTSRDAKRKRPEDEEETRDPASSKHRRVEGEAAPVQAGAAPSDHTTNNPEQNTQSGTVANSQGSTLRPPPLDRTHRRINQETMLSNLEFSKLPKIKRLLGRIGDEDSVLTFEEDIGSDLLKIYYNVQAAVESYLRESELHPYQPVVLESHFAYPRELRSMLTKILGDTTETADDRSHLFHTMQDKGTIGYDFFIRSLLAAALEDWCLDTDLGEQLIYNSYGAGLVEQVLGKWLDPVVEARLREKLMVAYVDKEIKPLNGFKARQMASKFQTFVDLLLPRVNIRLRVQEKMDVTGIPGMNLDQVAGAASPPAVFEEPGARIDFRNDLVSIFESALDWRTETRKNIHEGYRWIMPVVGQAVTTETVREVDDEGNPQPVVVALCVWPITYREVREKVTDMFSPFKKVANGVII